MAGKCNHFFLGWGQWSGDGRGKARRREVGKHAGTVGARAGGARETGGEWAGKRGRREARERVKTAGR